MQRLSRQVQPLSECLQQQDGHGRERINIEGIAQASRLCCVEGSTRFSSHCRPMPATLAAHRGLTFGPTSRLSCISPYGLLGCRSAGLKLAGQAGRAGCRSRRSCGTGFSRSCRETGSTWPCCRATVVGHGHSSAWIVRTCPGPGTAQVPRWFSRSFFRCNKNKGLSSVNTPQTRYKPRLNPIPAYAIPSSICGARKERVGLVGLGRSGWHVAASFRQMNEVSCQLGAGEFNHPEAGNHLRETLLATPNHDGCREAPQRAR